MGISAFRVYVFIIQFRTLEETGTQFMEVSGCTMYLLTTPIYLCFLVIKFTSVKHTII